MVFHDGVRDVRGNRFRDGIYFLNGLPDSVEVDVPACQGSIPAVNSLVVARAYSKAAIIRVGFKWVGGAIYVFYGVVVAGRAVENAGFRVLGVQDRQLRRFFVEGGVDGAYEQRRSPTLAFVGAFKTVVAGISLCGVAVVV